ncbi:hypothetical protein DM02DRAFT_656679 [Periconia macrospinosa]|uniref:Uncharacterized protein n=1 Tax=Periconia macrospinosa TaxID=97972 RepID=A0A2V1DPJ6_9PLEO|nr:hypothetical protein DM02DRAFT_656679 [Periconia macrospinosa]
MNAANPLKPQLTYDSTMTSDSSISSASSSDPFSYRPNTGASRSSNSATSISPLYDDGNQADRTALVQALRDPAVAELMERAARACKVKRDNSGICWYASQVCSKIH